MARVLTADELQRENVAFRTTGGVSEQNRDHGFRPAFLDTETGRIYLSRNRDGSPAPFHCLDGLPEELIAERDGDHRVVAVKISVVSGFERDGCFYTRDQAACMTCPSTPPR